MTCKSGTVFPCGTVAGVANVAISVAGFISLEVGEWRGSASGQRAVVSVVGVVAIIDVAVEAMGTVKPGAGSDEETTVEPIGAVVAVRSAIVGGIVEIAVGADRGGAKVDADRDLRGRHRYAGEHGCGETR